MQDASRKTAMGEIQEPTPVLPVLALFSRYEEALDWATELATRQWGPIALRSERFVHEETRYYEKSMGTGLRKMFLAFERLADPGDLADRKIQANQWEADYRTQVEVPEERPLNLDPGYLTEAKLVLASTKDRDHRIYLTRGVLAEVTLAFHAGCWTARPWTYPDYQRADYHEFFDRCRGYLRRRFGRRR